MKNSTALLIALTLAFAAFVGGFCLGRSTADTEVQISVSPAPTASTELVNINTASAAELATLPGISTALARKIIDYRETFGAFRYLGELLEVDGIGPAELEKLIEFITI